MSTEELVVKTRIAQLLKEYGLNYQPEQITLSVVPASRSHTKVKAVLPNGDEYQFDFLPGYGFPEHDDAALPPEVEAWLNEQGSKRENTERVDWLAEECI